MIWDAIALILTSLYCQLVFILLNTRNIVAGQSLLNIVVNITNVSIFQISRLFFYKIFQYILWYMRMSNCDQTDWKTLFYIFLYNFSTSALMLYWWDEEHGFLSLLVVGNQRRIGIGEGPILIANAELKSLKSWSHLSIIQWSTLVSMMGVSKTK